MIMDHPVVYWEIGAKEAKSLQGFYAELFNWKVDTSDPQYAMVNTGGSGGINGGIMQLKEGMQPSVTFYVQVDDLQAYLDRAARLGAKTVVPPTPIPDIGAFAMFADPDGHTIGLLKLQKK
jgi:predicted enzyme related to lactoylglutathione lyase